MPGNINGDDTLRKLTQEQIDILAEKHAYELVRIAVFVLSGDLESADILCVRILTEEGLIDENSS